MLVENLSFEYGTDTIFKDVSFMISEHDKVGLVGPNGAGKTTFFKLLLGILEPSQGDIIVKKGTKIGWLPQIISESEMVGNMTAREFILSARPIAELEYKLNSLYDKIDDCHDDTEVLNVVRAAEVVRQELEALDWYEYESIMLNIVHNMKITDAMLELKLSQLSGGQKSKVAFARLLYSKNDMLLLDEPTNHLDNESKEFVIDFLKKYKGIILVISHDISFLNEVTNVTLFLDNRTHKVIKYNGNYSVFERLHAEYENNITREAKKQDDQIEKLENIIRRLDGASGKRKKMAQDREKKLERIMEERIVVQPKKRDVDFKIEQMRQENNIPVSLKKVTFIYPKSKKTIISNLSIEISKKERFLVVGPNGAGKSTLLKLISATLRPNSGEVLLGSRVDIGYYAQEHEGLILESTILENLSVFGFTQNQLRKKLASFLFFGEDVNKKVSVLSPGERARVALAKLAMSGCNTILLDEPTNHLDPETQSIIAQVFKEFSGTMIVVSHNPNFVDELGIERMLVLPEGHIVEYNKKTVQKFYKINTSSIDNR